MIGVNLIFLAYAEPNEETKMKLKKDISEAAAFMNAESAEYQDYGKSEVYRFFKNGKVLTLNALSNIVDGAWINLSIRDKDQEPDEIHFT